MKKTFTINISGSVFHIEEDAFEKLQDYLHLLNHHFTSQAGGQEILEDIESRIAELLQEKITGRQEAVTSEWVEEVMHRMGKPEDFMDAGPVEDQAKEKSEPKGKKPEKRLYRDTENRVLGGVCSGMSAYFNFDPVFIRILFILLVFVGIGIFAVIYLILWIVVPKAATTAQRLEMRGEEATISNIQKTIQEEVKEVKDSFSRIGRSESFRRGKDAASKVGQASVQVGKGLGKAIGVIFGSLLILTGFFGMIAFLISLTMGGVFVHGHSVGVNPDVDLSGALGLVFSPGLVSVAVLLIVLLVGIPLLTILFAGTKLVFRYKTNNKLIGLGAFGIWLVALVAMLILTTGQFENFSQKSTVAAGRALDNPACKTLFIELGDIPEKVELDENARFEDFSLLKINGDNILAGNPRLSIEATDAPDFSVIIKKTSRGKNGSEVRKNIGLIQYKVASRDSTLVLDPYFTIENQAKWRNQEVQVTVKVPKGKRVNLASNLGKLRFDFENINNIWNKDMAGKTWVMTPEGLSLNE